MRQVQHNYSLVKSVDAQIGQRRSCLSKITDTFVILIGGELLVVRTKKNPSMQSTEHRAVNSCQRMQISSLSLLRRQLAGSIFTTQKTGYEF